MVTVTCVCTHVVRCRTWSFNQTSRHNKISKRDVKSPFLYVQRKKTRADSTTFSSPDALRNRKPTERLEKVNSQVFTSIYQTVLFCLYFAPSWALTVWPFTHKYFLLSPETWHSSSQASRTHHIWKLTLVHCCYLYKPYSNFLNCPVRILLLLFEREVSLWFD